MTAIEFIDDRTAREASQRSRRQLLSVRKWILSGCQGTVEWPTGVGKTRIATEAIAVMHREVGSRTYAVVVPTIQLKEQWEEGLKALGQQDFGQVIVINSLVRLRGRLKVDLLILDEIHRYAARTFSKVFDVAEYEYVLGLTATLKRLDKKHKILEEKAKIIDRMSLLEARRERYIAEFKEYNLGIEMSEEERVEYRELAGKYAYNMDKFHQDFDLMKRCSMGIEPKIYGTTYTSPPCVEYARRLGWRGNTAYAAYQILVENRVAARGEKQELWGGDAAHPYHPQRLFVCAIQGMLAIRKMKAFIHAAPAKMHATVALIRAFDRKTIVFGETISRVEEVHTELPEITVVYHSGLKAKQKKESMTQIMTNPAIKAVLTARALDQGFDWPAVELGIIESRTSSPTQQTQRRGRVVRLHTFDDGRAKKGVIINVYLKDTKDYDWLNKAQVGSGPSKWVESIDEILRAEGLSEMVSPNL